MAPDAMQQTEQMCSTFEIQNTIPINEKVSTATDAFRKNFKESTAFFPNILSGNKSIDGKKLQATLDGILKGMLPEIEQNAKKWCQSAKKAIETATAHLKSQQTADTYVLNNQPEKKVVWLWIPGYVSLGATKERMEAAWVK